MAYPRYDRLKLRHIRLIELIEQDGSLRAVAERLNMSQPAVSAMVRDLEEAFGAQLVERSVRGVTLNAAGRLALTRTRPSLAFVEQMAEEIAMRDLPLLRVGVNPAVMLNPVPMALQRLRSGQVMNRFTFRTGLVNEMVDALIMGEIDCYIGRVNWTRIAPEAANVLLCQQLGQSSVAIGCAKDHPLTRQEVIRPRDLLAYPWAAASEASSNWIDICTQFRKAGVIPPIPSVSAGLFGILSIASSTDYLFCVPAWVVQHRMTGDSLTSLDVEGFDLIPAGIDFASLVAPEPGTPLGDWLSALQASADRPGIGGDLPPA